MKIRMSEILLTLTVIGFSGCANLLLDKQVEADMKKWNIDIDKVCEANKDKVLGQRNRRTGEYECNPLDTYNIDEKMIEPFIKEEKEKQARAERKKAKDDEYNKWIAVLNLKSRNDVDKYKKNDFTLQEAKEWKKAGFAIEKSIAMKKAGFSLTEAKEWKSANFNVKQANDWKSHGFSPKNAVLWSNIGLTSVEAKRYRAKGLTPKKAKIIHEEDERQNAIWDYIGYQYGDGLRAKSADWAKSAWSAVGITQADTAKAWADNGFKTPDDAKKMIDKGYKTPEKAKRYLEAKKKEKKKEKIKNTHPLTSGKTYNCEYFSVNVGDHGVHVEGMVAFTYINADLNVVGTYDTHYQLRGYDQGSYKEITAKILTAKGIKKGSTTNFIFDHLPLHCEEIK